MEAVKGTLDMMTFFHHVVILGFGQAYYWNAAGGIESLCKPLTLVCLLVGEMSNPYLTVRTMLKLTNKKHTVLYIVNDIIFAITWILARSVIGPILLIYCLPVEVMPFFTKLGLIFTLFIS